MTYDKGCVSYSPGPLNACCMHRNCIITVQLFISYLYQIDDLRDCSGFVVICSIFSWTWLDIFFNEVNEEFYFYTGMQQQKAPLILSIKPSQNLTHLVYLYFQLNYIFWYMYMWHIYRIIRIMTYVSWRKRSFIYSGKRAL